MSENRPLLISSEASEVPSYSQVEEIKRRYGIDQNRDLVEVTWEGLRRMKDSDRTRPGGIYVDVPRYIRGFPNVARMLQEVALLRMLLPDGVNIIADHPHYSFILLENFPLGAEYTPSESHVLIRIPPSYPQTPPGLTPTHGIFLTGGLKYRGRSLECGKDQYHWMCGHNPREMQEKGWAWWCFARLESWDPYKDNLFKVVVLLSETLANPSEQRFG